MRFGCRLRTGRARELEVVGRPAHPNVTVPAVLLMGAGNPANRWLMDTHRGNLGGPD